MLYSQYCIEMSKCYTYHASFGLFNWVLLLHGLSGFIFNTWNRSRLVLIGSVICITFWLTGGWQYINSFVFSSVHLEDDLFVHFFNLIDTTRWAAVTLNTHFLNFFKSNELQNLMRNLFALSSTKNVRFNVKFFFNCIIGFILSFYYCGLLLLRWHYVNNNGVNWFVLPIYCFQVCTILFEQIFMLIVLYQLKHNIQVTISIRPMVENFGKHLDLCKKVLSIFGRTIFFYLLNFMIGTTFYTFTGLVDGRWKRVFYEQIVWDGSFVLVIGCIYFVNEVSLEVSS